MSHHPRFHQKQILRLDRSIELPDCHVDSIDGLLSLVRVLHNEKSLSMGIASVGRILVQSQVKLLLFASDVNPPGLIQHLLQMAINWRIPVIATGIGVKQLGHAIGLRSAAVLAVRATARDDLVDLLRPFAQDMRQRPQLPVLRVQSDLYVPRPKEVTARHQNPRRQ
jgi:ribosomal protein L7Ae-like RNA K-turn-binding protein